MESRGARQHWLWCGRAGTSLDLDQQQANSLLIKKEFVLSPEPIMEHHLKILNMKQSVCGVFQICTPDFYPIEDKQAYALFLNQLNTITTWVVTAETNIDGIFHCHCIMQTPARPDSVRRSMQSAWEKLQTSEIWTRNWGEECTLDLIKMQRCHKPEALLGYITKHPQWIIANNEQILQLAYDQDMWGKNERFKQEQPQQTTSSDMNEMSRTFVDIIMEGGCKSLEDMIKHNPEAMSKFLHRPGLDKIVQNCLSFVKATAGHITLQTFAKSEPDPTVIHTVLLHQGIKPSEFDNIFHKWFMKKELKKNTLVLQGPSNTGKSATIAGLKQCCPWGEIINGINFQYEGLIDQAIGVWEEPIVIPDNAEKWKQVSEGMTTAIQVKYKKPYILPRVPIIVTTNHDMWRFCSGEEAMMRNRMWLFHFNYPVKDQSFTPRTSEPSCECRACTLSRGGAPPDGGTGSLGSKQTTTEQQLDTGVSESATIDMADPGEGPSTRTIVTSSRKISRHTTKRSGSSTMPGTDRCVDAEHNRPSNPIHGIRTRDAEHVGARGHRDDNDQDTRGDGGSDNTGRRGGTKKNIPKHVLQLRVGLLQHSTGKETEIQIQTKKRKLDREMDAITLDIPSQQDWKKYLSFLFHVYENG
uniref:NS1 n=1 Tax=Tasmanian devil-associated chapparvovirus 5 TaxID=2529486 RepID=A0A481W828_9VIRU|nr:NS1 [Tasmanian devil-associated chapparvovirus 5]